MKALIDGDIVVHRCGYVSDGDPLGIAKARTDEMIELILADVKANEYQIWLSDSHDNNFRKILWQDYKANRVQPRPVHYQALKDYLFDEWEANLALGMEADDSLGIEQDKETNTTVICSIDKDLLQIPGKHYNFVKKEASTSTVHGGLVYFYTQLVMGDRSDNIGGFDGTMRQSLPKFLVPMVANLTACKNERQMFDLVSDLYNSEMAIPNNYERLLLNGKLMWIRRQENEVWTPPKSMR